MTNKTARALDIAVSEAHDQDDEAAAIMLAEIAADYRAGNVPEGNAIIALKAWSGRRSLAVPGPETKARTDALEEAKIAIREMPSPEHLPGNRTMTDPERFILIDAAAVALGLSTAHAYRLARDDKWRRTRFRPYRYALADIRATRARRKAEADAATKIDPGARRSPPNSSTRPDESA